jgi:hypothetical protein
MSEFMELQQSAKPPQEAATLEARWEAGAAAPDEVRFLQGPQPRGFELTGPQRFRSEAPPGRNPPPGKEA